MGEACCTMDLTCEIAAWRGERSRAKASWGILEGMPIVWMRPLCKRSVACQGCVLEGGYVCDVPYRRMQLEERLHTAFKTRLEMLLPHLATWPQVSSTSLNGVWRVMGGWGKLRPKAQTIKGEQRCLNQRKVKSTEFGVGLCLGSKLVP